MNKEEAQEAIRKISNIIDQWTDMRMDANDALELLAPLLKTVTSYFDLDPAAEEKRSMYEDLEKDLDKEDGDPPIFDPDKEKEKEELQEDLFSKDKKESDTEEETDND